MTQVYSDPERESDPHALPNFEVFYHNGKDTVTFDNGAESHFGMTTGYYYWPCFPGCLPDSDPIGPFETEESAIADLRE